MTVQLNKKQNNRHAPIMLPWYLIFLFRLNNKEYYVRRNLIWITGLTLHMGVVLDT